MKRVETKNYFNLKKVSQDEGLDQSIPLDQPLPVRSPLPIVEEGLQKWLDAFKRAATENNAEECYSILDHLRREVD